MIKNCTYLIYLQNSFVVSFTIYDYFVKTTNYTNFKFQNLRFQNLKIKSQKFALFCSFYLQKGGMY